MLKRFDIGQITWHKCKRLYVESGHFNIRMYVSGPTGTNHHLRASSLFELNSMLKKEINTDTSDNSILEALKSYVAFMKINTEGEKTSDTIVHKIHGNMKELLTLEHVNFSKDLLRRIFLLDFPSSTTLEIIRAFYIKNPKDNIDTSIALIALRKSLYDAKLQNALKITDLTVDHPNFITMRHNILKSGGIKLLSSTVGLFALSKFGINSAIDYGFLSNSWKHLSSINAMIITYLLNSSFFVSLVKFGREAVTAGGDYLTWQKGTFYTNWFKHSDEMMFCRKIMETDTEMRGGIATGAEASPEIVEEITRHDEILSNAPTLQPGFTKDGKKLRLLERKENLEDLKLQAYWMSGGDGFEWVEPDQDPAVLIWREHLAQFKRPQLNDDQGSTKKLRWAEELIDNT